MLVSREMHDLAAKVYYGMNTFKIGACDGRAWNSNFQPTGYLSDFVLSLPNLAVGRFVRRLEIHVKLHLGGFSNELAHKPEFEFPKVLHDEDGLLCLVEPHKGAYGWREQSVWKSGGFISPEHAHSAYWQYSFPAVKKFKIVLIGVACFYRPDVQKWRERSGEKDIGDAIKELSQYAKIPIQPRIVEVKVDENTKVACGYLCKDRRCAELLQTLIKGMVHLRE